MVTGTLALLARGRRVPRTGWAQLTSKIGPKNFYKGKGVPSAGKHTSKGERVCQAPRILLLFRRHRALNAGSGAWCKLLRPGLFAGGYRLLQGKLPNFVVPDLTGFKVWVQLRAVVCTTCW